MRCPAGRSARRSGCRPLLSAEILAPDPAFYDRPSGPVPVAMARAFAGRRSGWTYTPIPAFLIDHPTAGAILVDTGLHASVATDPKDNLGALGARMYQIRMRPEQAIPAQLEALGVDAHEVRTVVMTHLHYDHASGVSQFPQATFVVSRAEWEAAAGGGTLQGYRPRQFDHAFDWRTIDYEDAALLGSFAAFGRSVDLFADGSVHLVFTPGHTLGHQSVVVRLHDRELLLTGDAAYRRRTIDPGETPLLIADEHLFARSLNEIRQYLDLTPTAEVICGHDPQSWPDLREIYS